MGVAFWMNLQERRAAVAAQHDAEAQRNIAQEERQKSDQALADVTTEQRRRQAEELGRRDERKKSVPAFLKAARLAGRATSPPSRTCPLQN